MESVLNQAQIQIESALKKISENSISCMDDVKISFVLLNKCDGMIQAFQSIGEIDEEMVRVYQLHLAKLKNDKDKALFKLLAQSDPIHENSLPQSSYLFEEKTYLLNPKAGTPYNFDPEKLGETIIQGTDKRGSRDLKGLKFITLNSVNHILEDIETHIKYGQDFNYEKDFKQVEELVVNLKKSIESF